MIYKSQSLKLQFTCRFRKLCGLMQADFLSTVMDKAKETQTTCQEMLLKRRGTFKVFLVFKEYLQVVWYCLIQSLDNLSKRIVIIQRGFETFHSLVYKSRGQCYKFKMSSILLSLKYHISKKFAGKDHHRRTDYGNSK